MIEIIAISLIVLTVFLYFIQYLKGRKGDIKMGKTAKQALNRHVSLGDNFYYLDDDPTINTVHTQQVKDDEQLAINKEGIEQEDEVVPVLLNPADMESEEKGWNEIGINNSVTGQEGLQADIFEHFKHENNDVFESKTVKKSDEHQSTANGVFSETNVNDGNVDLIHASTTNSHEEITTNTMEELNVIVINVHTRKDKLFQGKSFFAFLNQIGLLFGEQEIFHYCADESGIPWFSMANGIKPGVFDLNQQEQYQSPALCFFMHLTNLNDHLQKFEALISVAEQICVEFDGEIKDEKLQPLTQQGIEHLRNKISDHERQLLLQ